MKNRKFIPWVAAGFLALGQGAPLYGGGLPNTPPTISAINDQTIGRSGVLATSFTIQDAESTADMLTVTAASTNPALLSEASILISGSGLTRNLAVIPMGNQTGSAVVTLTVTDEQGLSASVSFTLTVGSSTPTEGNTPPGIAPMKDLTVNDFFPASIVLSVSDAETPIDGLIVTGSSSNQDVVSDSNIRIGRLDEDGNYRGSIIPSNSGISGATTITFLVEDPQGLSSSTSFTFTILSGNTPPPNTPPSISVIPDQTTVLNQGIEVPFTVADAETEASLLVFGAKSDNPALFPDGSIRLVPMPPESNMKLVVEPARNQHGAAVITVTVGDKGGLSSNTRFNVNVSESRPVRGDFNGDGNADILFQDADGFLAVWLMKGFHLFMGQYLMPNTTGDASYRIAGLGDFNRDGRDDIVFQHKNGTLAVWKMNGSSLVSAELLDPSSPGDINWRVAGVADLDRDGDSDLVFQHADGTLAAWLMDGIRLSSASLVTPANPGDSAWRVVGVADFDGEGSPDLLFQHQNGMLAVWMMNGLSLVSATLLEPSSPGDVAWRVVGVLDLNGDGKSDLLFQNSRDRTVAAWLMDGARMTDGGLLKPSGPGGTWEAMVR